MIKFLPIESFFKIYRQIPVAELIAGRFKKAGNTPKILRS
jgi:hypothetical protein